MTEASSQSSTGSNQTDSDSLVYLGTYSPTPRRPVRLMRAREWRARALADILLQGQGLVPGGDEAPLGFIPGGDGALLDFFREEDEVISPYPRVPQGQAVQEEQTSEETAEGLARENPVQALTAMVAPSGKGLLSVMVQFDGREVRATINTGTSRNFIAESVAKRLGLIISPDMTLLTTGGADAEGALGWVEAEMEIGPWKGRCSLIVLPLENYQIVLGLDFCSQAMIAVIPHIPGIMIWGYGTPSFIPACKDAEGETADA